MRDTQKKKVTVRKKPVRKETAPWNPPTTDLTTVQQKRKDAEEAAKPKPKAAGKPAPKKPTPKGAQKPPKKMRDARLLKNNKEAKIEREGIKAAEEREEARLAAKEKEAEAAKKPPPKTSGKAPAKPPTKKGKAPPKPATKKAVAPPKPVDDNVDDDDDDDNEENEEEEEEEEVEEEDEEQEVEVDAKIEGKKKGPKAPIAIALHDDVQYQLTLEKSKMAVGDDKTANLPKAGTDMGILIRKRHETLGRADIPYLKGDVVHDWLKRVIEDVDTIEGHQTKRRFKALFRKYRDLIKQIAKDPRVTLTMGTMEKTVRFVVGALAMLHQASLFGENDNVLNFRVEVKKWTCDENIFLSGQTLAKLEAMWDKTPSELEDLVEAEEKLKGLGSTTPTPTERAAAPRGRGGRGQWSPGTCYGCGAQGHRAFDCPLRLARAGGLTVVPIRGGGGLGGRGVFVDRGGRGGDRGGRGRGGERGRARGGRAGAETRTCHVCNEVGHISFNCPYAAEEE